MENIQENGEQKSSYKNGKAITAIVLGLLSVIMALTRYNGGFGLILGIPGIIFGFASRETSIKILSLAGIVLCSIGLFISIINIIISLSK